MSYEYTPVEWDRLRGIDTRYAQIGALVDDARTLVADLLEEGAPAEAELARLRHYLNWSVESVNRLKEQK